MIFLTVGSMFPFDRLIRSVDQMVGDGRIADPVVAQIGDGEYEPKNFEFDRFLDKSRYDRRVGDAGLLLGHAGAGTIALALEREKRLLVVPRLYEHREHVNNHQWATAKRFEELGHVLVAYDAADIPMKLEALKTFRPSKREIHPERLAERIGELLRSVRK